MGVNAWLTPDLSELSETQVERAIVLPGSLWYLVSGALELLADAGNWEQFGDASEEEMADFFRDVVDDYAMSDFRNVGMISAFCFLPLPFGWLALNGQTVAQSDYPELSAVAPAAWKSGSDINLPDLEDAFLAHIGDTATLGQFSGANTHTLTVAQLPSHNHTYQAHISTPLVAAGSAAVAQAGVNGAAVTGNRGDGQAHNNMPRNMGIIYAIYTGR